jgi:uncharacterized protein (DUF1800 family)
VGSSEQVAWLLRRAAFGAAPGDLAAGLKLGPSALLDRLVHPDSHGVRDATDPWDDAALTDTREGRQHAIDGWLERMRTTPRPLEERMAWVWHDHFATSLDKVHWPALMVAQIRTLQRLALVSFPELVHAMTVDPAMLVWLDGAGSSKASPNENHGRELLELFSVGVGAHTEADVAAAAHALTGWRVGRDTGVAVFVPRRHDDRPQTLLGREGVHDVRTVIDAACASPACASFVTGALVGRLLGPACATDTELVGDLAAGFRASGLEIRPLVGEILRAGLSRGDTAVVEAPVPWLVRAERATGARLPLRLRMIGLVASGQLPLRPPDVGGWPDHTAWLASATTVSRVSMAAAIAAAAPPDGAARAAARQGDLGALASALGRVFPFTDATATAISGLGDEVAALAIALAAPEQVVV